MNVEIVMNRDCMRRMEGQGWTKSQNLLGRLFSLKLHSDLDKVQWVRRTAGNDASNATLDETFQTHGLQYIVLL